MADHREGAAPPAEAVRAGGRAVEEPDFQYIVPNNATLTLVGDMSLDEARALGTTYFGSLPGTPSPPADITSDEPRPLPRRSGVWPSGISSHGTG
ncbi:MAG: hypothetical protein DMF98_26055 [Acidobacteria bacterium]|nr:MAG: hypothetical protein DMF98_26055 [Acidobacteriota bacterium]